MQLYRNASWLIFIIVLVLPACTATKKSGIKPRAVSVNFAQNAAQQYILSDSNLISAHVGISIFNPETQQYLYNYQGDKYFVPASNMKLFTCYAAMKYLGDSLVGLKVKTLIPDSSYFIQATADPTFLHPYFKNQPVLDFLKKRATSKFYFFRGQWEEKALGLGWAWDDYSSDYMVERSPFPIYGNVIRIQFNDDGSMFSKPSYLRILPLCINDVCLDFSYTKGNYSFFRNISSNDIHWKQVKNEFKYQEIPFITNFGLTAIDYLRQELPKLNLQTEDYSNIDADFIIHSQPTDSLLEPMMHNSDNFFAEQTLLMVSNEQLGVMADEKIIDTLLKTDFKGLPQKAKWVDGSGLSRYNLITPQDFVWVLTKMKTDFSWQRITDILPTGNEGTLSNYYKNLSGKIFAKTGTLSNQVALSGYLITKQNKTLVFSVLVNNHQTSTTNVRRAVEAFLNSVWEQY